jgi:hypothetical protein
VLLRPAGALVELVPDAPAGAVREGQHRHHALTRLDDLVDEGAGDVGLFDLELVRQRMGALHRIGEVERALAHVAIVDGDPDEERAVPRGRHEIALQAVEARLSGVLVGDALRHQEQGEGIRLRQRHPGRPGRSPQLRVDACRQLEQLDVRQRSAEAFLRRFRVVELRIERAEDRILSHFRILLLELRQHAHVVRIRLAEVSRDAQEPEVDLDLGRRLLRPERPGGSHGEAHVPGLEQVPARRHLAHSRADHLVRRLVFHARARPARPRHCDDEVEALLVGHCVERRPAPRLDLFRFVVEAHVDLAVALATAELDGHSPGRARRDGAAGLVARGRGGRRGFRLAHGSPLPASSARSQGPTHGSAGSASNA